MRCLRNRGSSKQRPEYRLTRIDAIGRAVFGTSVSYRPVPLSEAAVSRWVEETAAGLESAFGNSAAAREALREALFRPRFLPPASGVVAGRDGTTWVQREDDDAGTLWDVFSAAGERTRVIRGPPGLRLFDVSGRQGLGLLRRGEETELVEVSATRVR